MKITSKKQLWFCLCADYMMNRGKFCPSMKDRIKNLIAPDYIMSYLAAMRKLNYYKEVGNKIKYAYYKIKYRKLGIKLGFSIGYDVFGYGLVIPHYGTIIVGGGNQIGNYAVLHTSICISDNGKKIGDGLYCATGVKMTSQIILGNNISVGANSLVNKDYKEDNALIGGVPAKFIKSEDPWYIRDHFEQKVNQIEKIRKEYDIQTI